MPITEFLSRLPAFACALGLMPGIVLMSNKSTEAQAIKPTILLVHGAWADSSGWNGVVDLAQGWLRRSSAAEYASRP